MNLKSKIEFMLNEIGKNLCYIKNKQSEFWVIDKRPCVIIEHPNKIQKKKAIQVINSIETKNEYKEIVFVAVDCCLIQEGNCDFVIVYDKHIIFCEDKMNMTSKDKLEDNIEKDAMRQIYESKQYFYEKLHDIGKFKAFIGIPDFFTKNPNAIRKIQKQLTDKHKIAIEIGQIVRI